jgi:3-oxoacyl-[acyl-carrier protein] reductase
MTVSIITGGSRGLGLAAAHRLAADGHDLVLTYADSKSSAEDAVSKIGRAIAVRADVADEHDVAALFDAAERTYGGVDVVVHAAGVMPLSTVAELDLAALDLVLRTNLRGAFVVGREAARRVRPGGAIVNFSSSVTRFRREGNAAYTATKAGVEVLTAILAKEMRGRDVTVNAVAPGATATDMLDAFTGGDDRTLAAIAAGSPMNRVGTPDDIAEVVAFLAGPGRWVNGQTIFANGGAI